LSGASFGRSRFATTVVTTVGAEAPAAPSLHRTTRVPCCRCGLLSQEDSRKLWLWPLSRGRSSNETCKQSGGTLLEGMQWDGMQAASGRVVAEDLQSVRVLQRKLLGYNYR
jgi:hypothetical protein